MAFLPPPLLPGVAAAAAHACGGRGVSRRWPRRAATARPRWVAAARTPRPPAAASTSSSPSLGASPRAQRRARDAAAAAAAAASAEATEAASESPPSPAAAPGTNAAFRDALSAYVTGHPAALIALLDDAVLWTTPLFNLSGKAAVLDQLATTVAFLDNPAIYYPPASVAADPQPAGVEWTVSGVWGAPTRPRVLLSGGSVLEWTPAGRLVGWTDTWAGGGGLHVLRQLVPPASDLFWLFASPHAEAFSATRRGLLSGSKPRRPPPASTPDAIADEFAAALTGTVAVGAGDGGDRAPASPVSYSVEVQPGRLELVATTPVTPGEALHGLYEVPLAPAVLFTGEVRRREQYESVIGMTLVIEAATDADRSAIAASASEEEEAEGVAPSANGDLAGHDADGAAPAAWDGRRVVRWSIPAPSATARTPPPPPPSSRVAYIHAPTTLLAVARYTPPRQSGGDGAWQAATNAAAGLVAALIRDGWALAPDAVVRVTQYHGKMGWNSRGAPAISTFATVPGAGRAAEVAVSVVPSDGQSVPEMWEAGV
ncbi:hypothetical protein MMPV_005199 [Pyropia vietnamensis]